MGAVHHTSLRRVGGGAPRRARVREDAQRLKGARGNSSNPPPCSAHREVGSLTPRPPPSTPRQSTAEQTLPTPAHHTTRTRATITATRAVSGERARCTQPPLRWGGVLRRGKSTVSRHRGRCGVDGARARRTPSAALRCGRAHAARCGCARVQLWRPAPLSPHPPHPAPPLNCWWC